MAFSIYSSKTRKVQPSNSSPPSNSPGPPPSTPQQAGFLKNIRESFKASLHTFTHSPAAPSCALQSALNREDEDNDFVNKNSASSRGLAMNFNTTNLQTVRLREHLASSQGKVEGEEEDGHPLAPIQTMASGVGTPRNAGKRCTYSYCTYSYPIHSRTAHKEPCLRRCCCAMGGLVVGGRRRLSVHACAGSNSAALCSHMCWAPPPCEAHVCWPYFAANTHFFLPPSLPPHIRGRSSV